jgi:hypothetical protein
LRAHLRSHSDNRRRRKPHHQPARVAKLDKLDKAVNKVSGGKDREDAASVAPPRLRVRRLVSRMAT